MLMLALICLIHLEGLHIYKPEGIFYLHVQRNGTIFIGPFEYRILSRSTTPLPAPGIKPVLPALVESDLNNGPSWPCQIYKLAPGLFLTYIISSLMFCIPYQRLIALSGCNTLYMSLKEGPRPDWEFPCGFAPHCFAHLCPLSLPAYQ